jgi:hypothetical protein
MRVLNYLMAAVLAMVSLTMLGRTLDAQGRSGRGGLSDAARAAAQAAWQPMHDMALKYRTGLDMYMALKAAAHGGQIKPPYSQLPDWSGLWTVSTPGGSFTGPSPGGVMPKLTAAAQGKLKENAELAARGASYQENISDCGPPGYPMWLGIPFNREFIVRPEETWLTSETVNNVRRIYTDGRGHPPVEERYPLYYGDSIGFWDGKELIVHTNQLKARSFAGELKNSEEMETVEIWENIDAQTIEAKIWLWDPSVYTEPWYVTRRYARVDNHDYTIRINYWYCQENPNNDVFRTPEGSTQYKEFQFSKPQK